MSKTARWRIRRGSRSRCGRSGIPGGSAFTPYLTVLRDWLAVARDLLTETGSIFVQIGDENVHLVRCLLDEVFGTENCAAQIAFKSTDPLGQKGLPQAYDYLLWYAKDIESYRYRPIFKARDITDDSEYRLVEETPVAARRLSEDEFKALPDWNGVFRRQPLTSSGFTASCTYSFDFCGQSAARSAAARVGALTVREWRGLSTRTDSS